ncbi:cytochrome ubiquinol oxidase subunit I [Prosthecobacter sp.]|uniref:cytochrome ubiquinol oxidase subunit I n=1 Tax=Prosthecobacter sp. TaxID=1965333 RepID=UPI003784583D
MNDLDYARSQMAMSLAFHIIFAAMGIGMPVLMCAAEWLHLRTGRPVYLDLCKRWARGTAILFAVGAVSGTVLSFELGLLWPGFMKEAGAIIGMPFSLEGFAFFSEAIFLGIYLYGWKRISPLMHWLAGVVLAASGILSGVFVVTANAWMNAPAGFKRVNGRFIEIDPIAAMLNPGSLHQVLHMTLAALVALGFAVAGVHAFFLLRDRSSEFHRAALGIALVTACVSAPLQIVSGDYSARSVAKLQPVKLAAMEAHYHTGKGAPLSLGGVPNDERQTIEYAVRIPKGLSFLATHDPDARIPGLEEYPRDDWPNVRIVHWAFDLMILCGMALLGLSAWTGGCWWRKRPLRDNPWLLRAVVLVCPLGFVALEAGWVVTEVGRQPWIIQGVMRTADAVTPMQHIAVPFFAFTLLYFFLSIVLVVLMRRQFLETTDTPA